MSRNNGQVRREQRRADAKHRAETYDMEYGPVAERAEKRGYTHTPKAERKARTS